MLIVEITLPGHSKTAYFSINSHPIGVKTHVKEGKAHYRPAGTRDSSLRVFISSKHFVRLLLKVSAYCVPSSLDFPFGFL